MKSHNLDIVLSPCGPPKAVAIFSVLLFTVAQLTFAEPIDKSQHNLFHPTPREHMRELSADRPDATESPITVDVAHLQLEIRFFAYTHNNHNSEEVDSWSVVDMHEKIGVLNDVDV